MAGSLGAMRAGTLDSVRDMMWADHVAVRWVDHVAVSWADHVAGMWAGASAVSWVVYSALLLAYLLAATKADYSAAIKVVTTAHCSAARLVAKLSGVLGGMLGETKAVNLVDWWGGSAIEWSVEPWVSSWTKLLHVPKELLSTVSLSL